jgi:hypothetical protein
MYLVRNSCENSHKISNFSFGFSFYLAIMEAVQSATFPRLIRLQIFFDNTILMM